MIKVIVFDLGDVLIKVHYSKFVNGFAKYSDKSPEYILHLIKHTDLKMKVDRGSKSTLNFYKTLVKKIDLKISHKKFIKIWCRCFSHKKDMENLVKKLKKRYKLIMLSNTDPIHFPYIERNYSFLKQFDHKIASYKVKLAKPNQKIFKIAIKLSKVKPREIVFIDDVKDYTKVAKKLGMNCIWFQNHKQIVRDLRKLKVIF